MEHDIICHMVLSQNGHKMVTVTVTRSCDTEKIVKDSGINNIIQHSKSMLTLWIIYGH